MTYRVPPLTGAPCSCDACKVAGLAGNPKRPPVRTPDGELHGRELARWYAERDKTIAALKAVFVKSIPKAEIQTDLNGEPLR